MVAVQWCGILGFKTSGEEVLSHLLTLYQMPPETQSIVYSSSEGYQKSKGALGKGRRRKGLWGGGGSEEER